MLHTRIGLGWLLGFRKVPGSWDGPLNSWFLGWLDLRFGPVAFGSAAGWLLGWLGLGLGWLIVLLIVLVIHLIQYLPFFMRLQRITNESIRHF